MMEMNSYQNPIQYNLDKDAYELEVPQDFQVTADGILYEVKVEEIIKEKNHLFNCVTSAEDYPYVMEQYVKKQMHIFSSEVKVLVLFYDEELALYAAMPAWVSIKEISDEESVFDVSYSVNRVNRKVLSFQVWQRLSSARM